MADHAEQADQDGVLGPGGSSLQGDSPFAWQQTQPFGEHGELLDVAEEQQIDRRLGGLVDDGARAY